MSLAAVTTALMDALKAVSPALPTAWENERFDPPAGAAYQRAHLLPAEPENPTLGDDFYRERGLFQVTLAYPLNEGQGRAQDRAIAVRAAFKRGSLPAVDGVVTHIDRTPEIGPAFIDGDRYAVPVRVRFFANIQPEN